MQVVGGESAPAPLVLQLIKGVLGVGPIPIELAQRKDFVVEIGDQHGVLIAGHALAALAVGLDETEQPLSDVLRCQQHLARERTAQDGRPGFFGL